MAKENETAAPEHAMEAPTRQVGKQPVQIWIDEDHAAHVGILAPPKTTWPNEDCGTDDSIEAVGAVRLKIDDSLFQPVAQIFYGEEVFDLYANGMIGRATFAPSAMWVCTGAVRANGCGEIVRRYSLGEVIRGWIAWHEPDGTQRVRLTDRDHGSDRVWMGVRHEVRPVQDNRVPSPADGVSTRRE